MNLLIALGGTGQLVLHYYAQWWLLGVADHDKPEAPPLRALVLDPDRHNMMASLAFLSTELFGPVQPMERLLDGVAVPWVRTPDVFSGLTAKGATVASLFTGSNTSVPAEHPARAFFDEGSLGQSVDRGFYSRPALAPVLLNNEKARRAFAKEIDDAVTHCGGPQKADVVVVASLVGGAGGGLLVPVLDHLLGLRVARVMTVVLGPYFEAEHRDRARHESNDAAMRVELQERYSTADAYRLRSVALIDGSQKRDSAAEAAAAHLPWPHASDGGADPIAQACWAVDTMFHDSRVEHPASWPAAQLAISAPAVAKRWRDAAAARDAVQPALAAAGTPGLIEACLLDPLGWVALGPGLEKFLVAALRWAGPPPGGQHRAASALAHRLVEVLRGDGYSLTRLLPAASVRPDLAALRHSTRTLPFPGQPPRLVHEEALRVAARLLALAFTRSGGRSR
jgi:hypothetical protein